jgi:hypothetical protein
VNSIMTTYAKFQKDVARLCERMRNAGTRSRETTRPTNFTVPRPQMPAPLSSSHAQETGLTRASHTVDGTRTVAACTPTRSKVTMSPDRKEMLA